MLDPALRSFVDAPDDAEAERRLAVLLEEEAAPLVRRIVARKLRAHGPGGSPQDLEDVTADALLALLSRLQGLRGEAAAPVESFADYTATVAHNTFAHYLRRRHPARSRLKNRLRYVFAHDRRLAMWPAPDGMACGLAPWAGRAPAEAAARDLDRLVADPDRWLTWTGRGRSSRDDPAELARAVLQAVGDPVDLDQLVGAIASLAPAPDAEEVTEGADLGRLPDRASVPADVALDQRRDTERLWREISALPVRQRAALLLNLRDERGAGLLWVLPMTGVANIRQIADLLEMPAPDLAEMWNRLPVDDHTIASRLGCTRQQVINLRSAARKRLARRLAERAGPGQPSSRGNTAGVSASLADEE